MASPCIIGGKFYASVMEAAVTLRIPYGTLHEWLVRGKRKSCRFATARECLDRGYRRETVWRAPAKYRKRGYRK